MFCFISAIVQRWLTHTLFLKYPQRTGRQIRRSFRLLNVPCARNIWVSHNVSCCPVLLEPEGHIVPTHIGVVTWCYLLQCLRHLQRTRNDHPKGCHSTPQSPFHCAGVVVELAGIFFLSGELHHEHKAAIPTPPVPAIISYKLIRFLCHTMHREGWQLF
jgi:hypothetical protein